MELRHKNCQNSPTYTHTHTRVFMSWFTDLWSTGCLWSYHQSLAWTYLPGNSQASLPEEDYVRRWGVSWHLWLMICVFAVSDWHTLVGFTIFTRVFHMTHRNTQKMGPIYGSSDQDAAKIRITQWGLVELSASELQDLGWSSSGGDYCLKKT